MIGNDWSSSSDSDVEDVADPASPCEFGSLKCYYSTVHTVKAEGVSMRPMLQSNRLLR